MKFNWVSVDVLLGSHGNVVVLGSEKQSNCRFRAEAETAMDAQRERERESVKER